MVHSTPASAATTATAAAGGVGGGFQLPQSLAASSGGNAALLAFMRQLGIQNSALLPQYCQLYLTLQQQLVQQAANSDGRAMVSGRASRTRRASIL